jgi:anhydro-N-acetylmuramic acid kinase
MSKFLPKNIIGLMSGTSADGLDMAFCRFDYSEKNGFFFDCLDTFFAAYPFDLRKMIQETYHASALQLAENEQTLTEFWSHEVKKFAAKQSQKIDALSMHGQTVFHRPEKGFTLQIGNPAYLAAALQLPVIADFRSLDIAYGGQGAPLVPFGDKHLFKNYDCCLNLGGIANISNISTQNLIRAYDVCPFNLVLNELAQKLGYEYDEGGKIAENGNFSGELFEALNALPFYQIPPPRSLGREWTENICLPLIESFSLKTEDALHTFLHHAAKKIAEAVPGNSRILVSGGGAHNAFFMKIINENNSNKKFLTENKEVTDFKEAVIFAFLGYLRLFEHSNTLASVTGASRDSCGGAIWLF